MDSTGLFLASDAGLRSVIDRLAPDDLDRPVPPEWTRIAERPVVRDIVFAHAYDEAWVPDLLAGKSLADGDPWRHADLLGDDPVGSYDAINDRATDAVSPGVDPDLVLHFQYGDYPASEGLLHLATYRGMQSWDLAHHLGMPFHLDPAVVQGFDELVVPHADEWRAFGVFPPAVEPPPDADPEARLLATLGFWKP